MNVQALAKNQPRDCAWQQSCLGSYLGQVLKAIFTGVRNTLLHASSKPK